jgi:hypothetical protein
VVDVAAPAALYLDPPYAIAHSRLMGITHTDGEGSCGVCCERQMGDAVTYFCSLAKALIPKLNTGDSHAPGGTCLPKYHLFPPLVPALT